ncbi:DUF1837 domain-containing protein [Xanthomonas hydrangeae]|uniref:DUF1837 domain-containing protein n=1 Tax=Xanthomonas hydrangeae TaxID=2775159 RepID=A0AAU0BCQ1_9XANT|nr:DUF1837 domain-containing protein [Xanthomonas hydrangeae]WOB50722.1 DUF1837 domain-containing protein [Xanthomonas hydrangeae]
MGSSIDDVDKLEAALKKLEQSSNVSNFLAKCDCGAAGESHPKVDLLFARFREDSADLEALAEFLATQIVNYVIPLKKRRSALAAAGDSDFSPLHRLVLEARQKFIEFDSAHPGRASEIGELLAFLVAQEWLGAFQVASKMALKTSANMPVHGLDGIHARFEDGVLILYFLESKLSETAAAGMSAYCDSAAQFAPKRKQYLLEYSIVTDLSNLDSLDKEERDLALDYFDVYGSKKSQRIERSVGVICYPEKEFNQKLPKSDSTAPSQHEAFFASKFSGKHAKYQKDLAEKLSSYGLAPSDCRVCLVAVPDKNALRKMFVEGVSV